jgi:hypothetical protein
MSYNLTENQKTVMRWIVQQVREGHLDEEFSVFWLRGAAEISGFEGEHPRITRGTLDALAAAQVLQCRPAVTMETSVSGKTHPKTRTREVETARRCSLTGSAYEAVDQDFEAPPPMAPAQVTIGALIQSMSGGSVQAVGIAEDADVSQVVNDANLLQANVKGLAEELMVRVKAELNVDDLAEYAQALKELKDQLLAEKPDPSFIQRSVRTLGLLGDVEGTIALMTRVWPLLYPLLLIAVERMGQLP